MNLLDSYLFMTVANVVGGPVAALLFGLLPEPHRQRAMAVLVAGGGGVYLLGPFGWLEVPLALACLTFAFVGLTRYWGIGVAWLLHALIDVLHHGLAAPMLPGFPLFHFGCAVIDPLLAVWFFAGAPRLWALRRAPPSPA